MRQIIQICMFIIAILLIILCIIQSNKGSNVLDGLVNSNTELFENKKEFGFDKTISRVIAILMVALLALSLIDGCL